MEPIAKKQKLDSSILEKSADSLFSDTICRILWIAFFGKMPGKFGALVLPTYIKNFIEIQRVVTVIIW